MKNTIRVVVVTTILAASVAIAVEKTRPAEKPTPFAVLGTDQVSDGRLMAPFYEYFNWPHAVETQGHVFCVFENARAQSVAMAYDTKARQWAGPVKISTFHLNHDDHGNPALLVDGEGYLHVFYGCHTGPMRQAKSRRPWDIAEWDEQPSPTPKATYPQVMRMADGRVLLFYRAGGHMEPWTMRESRDEARTWQPPEAIVEMRRDPPDRLAAAYCSFLPGAQRRTVHLVWSHKDDNAARVNAQHPHPWRPLKYPGMHEAVYRYNVYYLKRQADGRWLTATGQSVALPVSRAEANRKCLVYDSGDELTSAPRRVAIDRQDRPYLRFATGVYDWVKHHKDPSQALMPVTDRYADFADGRWRIRPTMPPDWPADVRRLHDAPGSLANGDAWPGGHWFIFSSRQPWQAGAGCSVLLYSDQTGYATHESGPVVVE